MRRGVLAAAFVCVLLCEPARAGDIAAFHLADTTSLAPLFVGEFTPGTLERGPVEGQTPTVRLPVTGIQLTVDTGGDSDCGAGIGAAAALAKPDVTMSDTAAGQCLLLADISLAFAHGTLKFEGQCDEWREGVSYCWVEGDIGQFWLRRQPGHANSLQVLFGPLVKAAEPAIVANKKGDLASSPIPIHGIMLDSVFDDAGRVVFDRWLLLPVEVVRLDVVR